MAFSVNGVATSVIGASIASKAVSAIGNEVISRNDLLNMQQKDTNLCMKAIRIGSALVGCGSAAVAGFAVGSIFPGIGNFFGGIAGLIVGCGLGGFTGHVIEKNCE